MAFDYSEILVFSHKKGMYDEITVMELIHERTALKVKGSGPDPVELRLALEVKLRKMVTEREGG